MNVLVAGKNAYIGTHLKEWLINHGTISVEEIEMRDETWSSLSFIGYMAVVYVAAIVHRQKEKVSKETYYRINAELPRQVAEKAKREGVRQFIYLSSMAVYGKDATLFGNGEVSENTTCAPKSAYAKSKLYAEELLRELEDDAFSIAVVRPPNVYGSGCPGNYFKKLYTILKRLPVFPDAFRDKRRSYIYIDNLSEYIRLLLLRGVGGIYCPQDEAAISTVQLAHAICNGMGKDFRPSRTLGAILVLLTWFPPVRKLYGALHYDPILSARGHLDYHIVPMSEGIAGTVKGFMEK